MFPATQRFRSLAGLLLLAGLVASAPGAAHAEKGRVINLVRAPAERQRLLRFVEKKLARIYEASEDRVASSPTRLQPFNGSPDMIQRWDRLSGAVLSALRAAPQVKLRTVTERPADAHASVKKRTVLFELFDGEKNLGQLAISRRLEVMKSPWFRKELKTEIAFDPKVFFESGREPLLFGEFFSVDTGMGSLSTGTRCIVPHDYSVGASASGKAHETRVAHRPELPIRSSTLAGLPLLEDNVYPADVRNRQKTTPLSFAGTAPREGQVSGRLKATLEKMPALPWITRRFNPNAALGKVKLLGLQHLLENTGAMLVESGVPARSTHLWGKEYSIFEPAVRDLSGLGFQVHKQSVEADRLRVTQLLRQELSKIDHPERIQRPQYLLLDDGGTLLEMVGRMVAKEFPRHAHLLAGVEQTTKGVKRLKKLQRRGHLPFHVVNVGGSTTKHLLSPIYGYAIGKEAVALKDSYARSTGDRLSSSVVFGFGHIGAAVAEALKSSGPVTVFDKSPALLEKAAAMGFAIARSKEEALPLAQILISCTGTPDGNPTITTEDLPKLPIRALVANGGSPKELRLHQAPPTSPQRLDANTIFTTHLDTGAFADEMSIYSITPRSGWMQQVYVGKSGGVLNFPRGRHSYGGSAIPERYVQADVGLLYLGLLQAVKGGPAGLNELKPGPQRELFDFVQGQLSATNESLTRPGW